MLTPNEIKQILKELSDLLEDDNFIEFLEKREFDGVIEDFAEQISIIIIEYKNK